MHHRQHDATRAENMRMIHSLATARRSLTTGHKRKFHDDEVAIVLGQLAFLEHVLEFSATWNGVESQEFFPDKPLVADYLKSHKMLRLKAFFERNVREVANELKGIGVQYPFLLEKLHHEFYQRTFQNIWTPPPAPAEE